MKTKILLGLLDKLDNLLEEHTENFIAQRPFLWGEEVFDCENLEEREYENKLKIKKTIEEINKGLVKKVSNESEKSEQGRIF